MGSDRTRARTETSIDNVGDAIVAALSAGGIDHLFFTSGSEIGFYQESIAKARAQGHDNPIRLVTVPLEHVSLNAALGFAAVTGRPAATAAHVDCGTLHYGGAIHSAWRNGLPVVITAGFPPTAETGSMAGARDEGGHLWMQQTYDQNAIVRQYTKWDHKLAYQDNPGTVTSRAIQVARSAPWGPVYLSIPKEISLLPMDDPSFASADQLGIPRPSAPDPEFAEEMAERIIAAENPAVVVSSSGRDPEAVPALVELCELLGIAVCESALRHYLSFPFSHPLYRPFDSLAEADVVLALDTDVPWLPGPNAPAEGAYVAAVSQDPIKLRIPTYEFTADDRVAADPRLTVLAITAAAKRSLSADDAPRIARRRERLATASAARRNAVEAEAKAHSGDSPIDTRWLSYQVGQTIDDNCILLDDTLGRSRVYDFLPCDVPRSYIRNQGSSGGWGPGAAFGAKLGAPDKDVVMVTGDGFYMFGTPVPAIWAAVHHDAPFLSVVYTNRSYTTGTEAVRRVFGDDGYAARGGYEGGYFDPPPDFAKEAEAAGAYGENVRESAEVGAALQRGLEQVRSGRPAVISVWLKRLVDGG